MGLPGTDPNLGLKFLKKLKFRIFEFLSFEDSSLSHDGMDKLEEQGMKKISSIKQNVIREKRKIIRDKLRDKTTTWTLFKTEKEEEDKKNEVK